jgi:hypothetical protein
LDEALQPIVPQIPNLMEYVRQAKRECCDSSEHGLKKDESASIYLYTIEWGDQSLYKLIHTALEKLPSNRQNLWHGVNTNLSAEFKKDDQIVYSGRSIHVRKRLKELEIFWIEMEIVLFL